MESKQIIRIVLLLLLGLIAGKTPVVWANDLIPVAVIGVDPGRTWFYDGEDVVFDSDDSYVPNGQGYIIYSKWYINGVYRTGGYYRTDMNICFRLNGSANNGCYELGAGQTTVQVTLEVTNSNQYGTHQTTLTYTVQEHKGRKYFVKDHLGNVRATVNRDGNVLGYDDYYPFGQEMPGHSNNTSNPDDSYKYTGHERDDEAGLTLDYMNARNYDPIIGRFMQIDPLADAFPSYSPYNYTFNNPVNFIDPTGENPVLPAAAAGTGLAAAGAAIGAAIGATAVYLVIDEVQDNRGYFEYVGATVKEQVTDVVSGIWNKAKGFLNSETKTELGDIADDIGEVANVPDLSGMTLEDADQAIKDAGFERTGESDVNRTYKPSNRDGSTITLKENGEVSRVPRTALDGAGQNVNKGARVIKNNNGWENTRDPEKKHSSQEKLKIDN